MEQLAAVAGASGDYARKCSSLSLVFTLVYLLARSGSRALRHHTRSGSWRSVCWWEMTCARGYDESLCRRRRAGPPGPGLGPGRPNVPPGVLGLRRFGGPGGPGLHTVQVVVPAGPTCGLIKSFKTRKPEFGTGFYVHILSVAGGCRPAVRLQGGDL